MPDSPSHQQHHSLLRGDAEAHLRDGIAPATSGWILSAEVLGTLYRLATDPEKAADAIKLLHELQVHQVELDLQLQQLDVTERETTAELTHYQGLFKFAPIGYLVLDIEGRIAECNVSGAKLLGIELNEIGGEALERFLAPGSRPAFTSLLNSLRTADASGSCTVKLDSHPEQQSFRFTATTTPGQHTILVAITEFD